MASELISSRSYVKPISCSDVLALVLIPVNLPYHILEFRLRCPPTSTSLPRPLPIHHILGHLFTVARKISIEY